MSPELQIYLLGTFRLFVKGAPVPKAAWQKRKAKMRLYIRKGERCLALRQYKKCADALLREFEVKPDEETENLKRQILLN